jgi:hypothetical protein
MCEKSVHQTPQKSTCNVSGWKQQRGNKLHRFIKVSRSALCEISRFSSETACDCSAVQWSTVTSSSGRHKLPACLRQKRRERWEAQHFLWRWQSLSWWSAAALSPTCNVKRRSPDGTALSKLSRTADKGWFGGGLTTPRYTQTSEWRCRRLMTSHGWAWRIRKQIGIKLTDGRTSELRVFENRVLKTNLGLWGVRWQDKTITRKHTVSKLHQTLLWRYDIPSKKDAMGGACSMHGRDWKRLKNLARRAWKE